MRTRFQLVDQVCHVLRRVRILRDEAVDRRDDDQLRLQLVASVIPSLIAWLALLMPVTQGLTVMALAFLLLFAGDLIAVKRGWAPAWYPRLRLPLTAVVALCLLTAAWV